MTQLDRKLAIPEIYEVLKVAGIAGGIRRCLGPVEPVEGGIMAVCIIVAALRTHQAAQLAPGSMHVTCCRPCLIHVSACAPSMHRHAPADLQVVITKDARDGG